MQAAGGASLQMAPKSDNAPAAWPPKSAGDQGMLSMRNMKAAGHTTRARWGHTCVCASEEPQHGGITTFKLQQCIWRVHASIPAWEVRRTRMASPRAAISASWRACSEEDATRSAALWLSLFASWGRSSSRLHMHHYQRICRGLG